MPSMPRRAAIVLPAGLAAFHVASVTQAGATPPGGNPDADLIRLCGEYIQALDAYNREGGALEQEEDPLWEAVEALEDQIAGLQAQTFGGLVAKARVAAHQARQDDGSYDFSTTHTGEWPGQVVQDLLRIIGEAA